MTLLRSVRAQASGNLVGANLAPVSHTSDEEEEDGSADLSGGRFDRNVCRAAESDGDGGIYVELCTGCGIRVFQIQCLVCLLFECFFRCSKEDQSTQKQR